MRIESGPAKADRNWQLVRTLLFFGFAAYFCYDGAIGYPNRNRAAAERELAKKPFSGTLKYEALPDAPTADDAARLPKSGTVTGKQVREALGEPRFTDGADEYYLSKWGHMRVPARTGAFNVSEIRAWENWFKSAEDIRLQFYCALLAALPGLWFLRKLVQAATLRAVLDDEGLLYGQQRIAFADMTALRDYSPKGWIDLYYRRGERDARLRLDNEKIALFDEIVAGICQVKGFPNEVQEYAQRKAREEQEKAEAVRAGDAARDVEDEAK
jgi:hypothetical protein